MMLKSTWLEVDKYLGSALSRDGWINLFGIDEVDSLVGCG